MRVLVTGGAGFIGSHIAERLLGQGDQVLVVDNLSTGDPANLPPEVRLEQLDIGDPRLAAVASSFRPDVTTHCAAQASVAVSMARPALDAESNILGGINVYQAAVDSGCAQFIYITTGGALYGPPDYLPCDEDHPIRPMSAYGLSKWTLEQYFRMLLPESMPLKVLRLANVYGPRQDPEGEAGVVAILGQQMLLDEPVTIFGDGEQTRDFVYAGDIARAHEIAQRTAQAVTVNISSGVATTVNELFGLMAAEVGYTRSPEHGPERQGDIKHSVLANSRAQRLLGWSPQTTIRAGLQGTMEWLRGQVSSSA